MNKIDKYLGEQLNEQYDKPLEDFIRARKRVMIHLESLKKEIDKLEKDFFAKKKMRNMAKLYALENMDKELKILRLTLK